MHAADGERARRRSEIRRADLRVGVEVRCGRTCPRALRRRTSAAPRRAAIRTVARRRRRRARRGSSCGRGTRTGTERRASACSSVMPGAAVSGTRDHLRPAEVHAVEHGERSVRELDDDRQRRERAESSPAASASCTDVVRHERELDRRRAAKPAALERRDLGRRRRARVDRCHALPHLRLRRSSRRAGGSAPAARARAARPRRVASLFIGISRGAWGSRSSPERLPAGQ